MMIDIELVKLSETLWMGKYPVTQAQWEAVMGNNPSRFRGPDNPVESVNWFEAQEFCLKLTASTGRVFRLPTSSEWEWACRAGTTTRYSFGDDSDMIGEYAWIQWNSGGSTHPVGQKKPNPWGLYDMYGNVWEWCADAQKGKDEDEEEECRMTRGGSWLYDQGLACAACRSGDPLDARPADCFSDLGFRVLMGGSWINYLGVARTAFRDSSLPDFRSSYIGIRVVCGEVENE